MAWTTPLTAVSNTALTAAQWNASVRDNLVETAPGKVTSAGQIVVSTGANAIAARTPAAAAVDTSQTSASTSYTDLTTIGPQVFATTGTQAICLFGAFQQNSANGAHCFTAVAVSGATTIAPNDAQAFRNSSATGGVDFVRGMAAELITGLTPGSNGFKLQYKVASGTGTWAQRHLLVIPL